MVDLSKLWPELRRLLELALAWLSGWVTKGLKTRADEAESRAEGFSDRLDLEADLRGLPDSELDERMRDTDERLRSRLAKRP